MASNTERSKKWRKKIRCDPSKHEEYKKKDRERKKKKYAEKKKNMSETQKSKIREKERLKKRVQAARKRLPSSKNTCREEAHDLFKSPQSLGKAVKRVQKTLPKQDIKKTQVLSKVVCALSPRKRRAVLESCDVAVKRRRSQESGRKIRSDALAEEEIKVVENFFNRDDVSRICPGKRDFLSVKTSEGRELRQKRLLLVNVNEAYELFKKEEPDLKIGRSKFASLRPRQVMPMSLHDQEVCMCKYHENINMILDGLKNILPEVPKYSEDLLIQTVCSFNQAKCMDRECQACGIAKPLDELFEDINDNTATSYFQWETCEDGRVRKQKIEGTIADAKDDLREQLQPFGRHVYNIKRQYAELKYLKESLQLGEVIIHEDFAENFQMKHQREVMAAHWSNDTVTLFTAVVYYRSGTGGLEHKSYAVISDDLRHDKQSVYAFNKAILEEVKKFTQVNKVHYWSDGAGSQFKNKYNLSSLLFHEQDFGAKATWSFFETAHGKGPVDGVGAEVKRAVWRSILQDKEVVSSPLEFHRVAQKVCNKVSPLYVPQAEVNNQTEKLKERWSGCRTIPRTHAIHFASKVDDVTISVAKNSQFLYNEHTRQHVLIEETTPAPSTPSSPTALTSDEDDDENAPSTQSSPQALSSDEDDDNAPSSPTALTSDEDDDDENAPSTQSSPQALSSDEDDDENAPSSPTALISDEEDDETEDEQDHKDVGSDECDRNESTEVEDNSDESNIGYQEQEQVHVQHGLPPDIHASNSMFTNSLTFQLPCFLAPMIDCIATGRIIFGGSSTLINTNDLKSLHGHGKTSEDKWVSNFVIDRYLELLKQASTNVQMEVITWEKFEKGVGAVPAKQVLKGINNILNQDLLVIPCNIDSSRHWFLLVVQPPLQRVMVFDSMPGSFIKPTVYKAIKKIAKLLKEVDGSLKMEEWSFYANKPGEIPSQRNDFDCGVFTCMYARSLVSMSPMIVPNSQSISDVRSYMILELHRNSLLPIPPNGLKVDDYYAVDYVSSYYFGRVIQIQGQFAQFKFLHRVRLGADAGEIFNWPARDDVADVHVSCVFYGPVHLIGNSPFKIMEHEQVKEVFRYIQRR